MTTYQPAYRLRVYKPRSEDATEAAVLVPAAGAPHSDAFQVASISGVAGYQPYLDTVRGRSGRLDLRSRRLDTGEYTFRLLDQRTSAGGSNLSRWVTAFFGSATGRARLGGLKAQADESIDGGATWTTWLTGRIQRPALDGRLFWELTVRENTDELAVPCFVGTPYNVSYAQRPSLLPLGLVGSYGANPITRPIKGTCVASAGTLVEVEIHKDDLPRLDNVITKYLLDQYRRVANAMDINNPTDFPAYLKAHVINTSVAAEGEFKVAAILGRGAPISDTQRGAYTLKLEQLPTTAPRYVSAGSFGAGNGVTYYVYADVPPSRENPIVVTDTHPVQILKDLLDGKFGLLDATGAALRTFPYDGSNFTTFIADTTIPSARLVIQEPVKDLRAFVEEQLLLPCNLAWRLNASGQVTVVDLRLPQTILGTAAITSTDLLETPAPEWEQDRAQAITVVRATHYVDRAIAPNTVAGPGPVPDAPVVTSTDTVLLIADFGDADLGQQELVVDARGFRALTDEVTDGVSRLEWVRRKLRQGLEEMRAPFGRGPMFAALRCRRNATTDAQPGDLRLVQVNELPDPATNLRGGTRLMRVVERTHDGPARLLRLLDMGLNVVATVPTLGNPAQEAGNTKHGATTVVTLNASSEPVQVQYAITATGVGSRPADRYYFWANRVTATGTLTLRDLPAGKRIWVRARSEPLTPLRLPSVWAYPATEYVDLVALTAPSSPATSSVTDLAALFTWTVGETAGVIVTITLATPAAGTQTLHQVLPVGSNRYQLVGLIPSTEYRVEVGYEDNLGGASARVGSTFTTAASGTVAGTLRGGAVYRGTLVGIV